MTLEQTVGTSGFIVSRSRVTDNAAGTQGGGIQNFGILTLYQRRNLLDSLLPAVINVLAPYKTITASIAL